VSTFASALQFGQLGESHIAGWLRGRGQGVLPVYEKEIDSGKGPQFFAAVGEFAAPDLFVFPACEWAEAKHKTVFTWYRKERRWTTGIDIHHFNDYLSVQAQSTRRVWLFFLHRCATPHQRDIDANCPSSCPTGLFCGSLDYLTRHESHRSDKHGPHGMVYWGVDVLKKVADLEEMASARGG